MNIVEQNQTRNIVNAFRFLLAGGGGGVLY